MWKSILYVIAFYNFVLALYMWFAPMAWYEATPGVAAMGPFNLHFIRDVALAYLVSALAIIWGLKKWDKTAAVFGALWPCLHALFHIWIWGARGFPFDQVFAVNVFGIQLPAWLAMGAAFMIFNTSQQRGAGG
ncbi:MAG: hypothetical protein EX271_01365 [Acidimicrobiales bacterium]|nr:hypothetical protein [Hyphomonadaceae bacterium]RZV44597.1 MAG: hypothetical protein EX271_01365 [Acidimicrobiales bacterium]